MTTANLNLEAMSKEQLIALTKDHLQRLEKCEPKGFLGPIEGYNQMTAEELEHAFNIIKASCPEGSKTLPDSMAIELFELVRDALYIDQIARPNYIAEWANELSEQMRSERACIGAIVQDMHELIESNTIALPYPAEYYESEVFPLLKKLSAMFYVLERKFKSYGWTLDNAQRHLAYKKN